MLYEMIGIVRPGSVKEVKDVARTVGRMVLQSGGVVRGLTNWGIFALPGPMRDTSSQSMYSLPSASGTATASAAAAAAPAVSPAAQVQLSQPPPRAEKQPQSSAKGTGPRPRYHVGQYFVIRFDSSARAQHAVRRTMGLDPRLLRYSMVKLGDGLYEIADIGGKTEEWAGFEGHEGKRWSELRNSSRAL